MDKKKKRSLRNEKLKANRASVTEEQRKEMPSENKKTETTNNSACPLSKDGSEETTMSWRATKDWRRWSLANSYGWPWRQKKKEEQDWRICSYQTAQVSHGE